MEGIPVHRQVRFGHHQHRVGLGEIARLLAVGKTAAGGGAAEPAGPKALLLAHDCGIVAKASEHLHQAVQLLHTADRFGEIGHTQHPDA